MISKLSSIKLFEKPLGMRDTFPQIYEQVEYIRQTGRNVLKNHGYAFVKTPALEYYDTVGKASAIHDATLFKLVDTQGNTLVLRPDMTTPITRLVTSKLLKEKNPQRLAYFASVFRAQQQEGGRPAQFEQMGIELIGDQSFYGDAEVIAVCIELLKELGVNDFKMTLGHAGVLACILKDYTETDQQANALNELLVERNFVGFEEAVKAFELPVTKENALLSFINVALNGSDIKQIEQFIRNNGDLHYLQQLMNVLTEAGYAKYITIDFTLASYMSYYTGMLFEVYATGTGFSIGNGGRYDGLLEYFNHTAGATGFSLRVDRLLEVLPFQQQTVKQVAVLFDEQNFLKALQVAKTLREEGAEVTLQAFEQVPDLDAYKAHYNEVVELVSEGESTK
jgi:ATP phosphoribosyltransferase regulatory subunit